MTGDVLGGGGGYSTQSSIQKMPAPTQMLHKNYNNTTYTQMIAHIREILSADVKRQMVTDY